MAHKATFHLLVSALILYRGIFFLVYYLPRSCICVLFIGTSELNMVPKYTSQVPSSVPQCKKAVIYITEKIGVLDKLHSGKSDSTVGHERSVDKSTIYMKKVVFEQKHTWNVFSSWQECLTRGSEEPKACNLPGSNGSVFTIPAFSATSQHITA